MKLTLILVICCYLFCGITPTELTKKSKKKLKNILDGTQLVGEQAQKETTRSDTILPQETVEPQVGNNRKESDLLITTLNNLKFNDIITLQEKESNTNLPSTTNVQDFASLLVKLNSNIETLNKQLKVTPLPQNSFSDIDTNQNTAEATSPISKSGNDNILVKPKIEEMEKIFLALQAKCGADLEDCYFLKRKDLNLEVKTDKAVINSIIALNHEISEINAAKN